jgi:hypothetical protein
VKLGAEEVSDLEASRCRTLVKAGMNGCRASREASSNTVTGRSKPSPLTMDYVDSSVVWWLCSYAYLTSISRPLQRIRP